MYEYFLYYYPYFIVYIESNQCITVVSAQRVLYTL